MEGPKYSVKQTVSVEKLVVNDKILFDWNTYNALTTLTRAAVLGMRLTEIPPADFSRRSRGEEYFRSYGEFARKAFTTVTAHIPYYNVVIAGREVREK